MELYLQRDESGYYSLRYFVPTWAKIRGTARHAWYAAVGEPVDLRNLCTEVTHAVLGGNVTMKAGDEPMKVELVMIVSSRVTPELRQLIKEATL